MDFMIKKKEEGICISCTVRVQTFDIMYFNGNQFQRSRELLPVQHVMFRSRSTPLWSQSNCCSRREVEKITTIVGRLTTLLIRVSPFYSQYFPPLSCYSQSNDILRTPTWFPNVVATIVGPACTPTPLHIPRPFARAIGYTTENPLPIIT